MPATPLDDLAWIDAVADRFEEAWAEGGRPAIGGFLAGCEGARRDRLLAHLLGVELAIRRRRGERPQAQEYEARFPANLDRVRAVLEDETIPDGTTFPGRESQWTSKLE